MNAVRLIVLLAKLDLFNGSEVLLNKPVFQMSKKKLNWSELLKKRTSKKRQFFLFLEFPFAVGFSDIDFFCNL